MKKYLLFGTATIFMLFFQRIWMEYFPILGAGPDLVLLTLVYFAAFHDPIKGLFLAFVLGFINDALFGYHPGMYATIYTIIFWTMHQLGKNFYLRSIMFQFVAAITVTIAFTLIEFIILTVFEVPVPIRVALWLSLPGRLLLNTLISPVLYRSLWAIEDISTPSLMRQGSGFGFI